MTTPPTGPQYTVLPVKCVDHEPDAALALQALRHSAAATFAARFPGGLAEFFERVEVGGTFLVDPPRRHELLAHEAAAGRPVNFPLDPDLLMPGVGFLFMPDWDDWYPLEDEHPPLEAVLGLYTPGADAATTLLSLGWIEDNILDLVPAEPDELPEGVLVFRPKRT